jgi:hypothetical protein
MHKNGCFLMAEFGAVGSMLFNLKFYGESLTIFEKLTPGNQNCRSAVIVVLIVNVIMKN